jgi:hypothetical protein
MNTRSITLASWLWVAALSAWCPPALAQTIRGTLRDRDTDRPIQLGRVLLLTEAGDSVAVALTNASGQFSVTSPRPGGFYLKASALGYRETTAGIFDIQRGGEMSLEFRIYPVPIGLAEILVNAPGGVRPGALIANGFYQRMQSGMGRFLTPAEIQKRPVLMTSELFYGISRVSVVPNSEGGGNRITISAPLGECSPPLYVDGILLSGNASDRDLPPMSVVEAIEVYRGASELPLQWSGTAAQGCGAIVIWTKR